MAISLVRFEKDGATKWGVVSGSRASPLEGDYPTTAGLIDRGKAYWLAAKEQVPAVSLDTIKILSPAPAPCRIYCRGANYHQHMIEFGMNPDEKVFNMFFTKSDASIASARGAVTRPEHVRCSTTRSSSRSSSVARSTNRRR